MKNLMPQGIILILLLLIIGNSGCKKSGVNEKPPTLSFDGGWRFIKANPSGVENSGFNDSGWRTLDLPHDWSIEDLPNQSDSVIGPFTKGSIGKMSTGYTVGGTAWYRKTFTIDKANEEKIVYLNFDGIYMNSDVWINGKHVGNHPYGYTSFYYNITSYLNPAGKPNVVAVQVKNEGKNSRWYSGSGIYRHTWLTMVEPEHIGVWGVYITTPVITDKSAGIVILSTVLNSGNNNTITLQTQIINPSGQVVGTTKNNISLNSGESTEIKQNITVDNPSLWSIETPYLYKVKVTILNQNKVTDNLTTSFGIRSLKFNAQTGFTLNGKNIELKGGCYHHDNGPLGSVAIDRAEERKIELLKKYGYNAIRCSHNPPSPYLLDVCDRIGMLVIDEAFDMWEITKNKDDYANYFKTNWKKDLRSIVFRDRNHPAVIMWSIGNEINEALDTAGLRIATLLTGEIRSLDTTRAVTEAFNDFDAMMGRKSRWDESASHIGLLDVVGYNYMYSRYEADHEKYPKRVMVATEFMPLYSLANWQMVEKHPYVIGNFAWVVMDYLGEAGVGLSRLVPDVPNKPERGPGGADGFFSMDPWPVFNDFQGDIDLIGNIKPRYYHQLVVWRQSKIEMLVHRPIPAGMKENVSPWGWPDELKSWSWAGHENEKLQVHVYTRSKLVKLELNGKIIGEQAVDGENSITATFDVPYEAGALTARCYDNIGTEIASETIKTVGKPASIRLVTDRTEIKTDRNDLSYVMVEILDSEGILINNADDILVNFEVNGNGEIAGVGSGSPRDMSSFQQPQKKTWHGKCLTILRPKGNAGKIRLKATAEGLQEATIEINCI
ncbi:MAG: glycoside hydrolase family 2 TIM barrel-domain containing protein [Bacteroidales bacterium]